MRRFFHASEWVKTPADRDIIAHRTVQHGEPASYRLAVEPPVTGEEIVLLALGDTGDSDRFVLGSSPQEAVAAEMAREAGPESAHPAAAILHMGDIVYMAGERRLYDACFLRPYKAFLAPESVRTNLVFRQPFFTVPGNHDYYDMHEWMANLASMPLLGAGLRAAVRQLFAFSVPRDGSDMGAAYQEAFIDMEADTTGDRALPYVIGSRTRLPNRYFRTRLGPVDLFALDSNTLDAPPPGTGKEVRAEAASRLATLEEELAALQRRGERARRELEEWERARRETLARERPGGEPLQALRETLRAVSLEADAYDLTLEGLIRTGPPADARRTLERVRGPQRELARRWVRRTAVLDAAESPAEFWEHYLEELDDLDELAEAWRHLLGTAAGALPEIPTSYAKEDHEQQRSALLSALLAWGERRLLQSAPEPVCEELQLVSELQLDRQRDLSLERRLSRYRPQDHDAEQLAWLDAGLAESCRTNPNGWRIVMLHHPLYTAITNHCEGADVVGVRSNLEGLLRDRVHLVLAGHSHGFEWVESSALPNLCLLVSGGGGQVTLRPPAMQSRRASRRALRHALTAAGVRRYTYFGAGPAEADGVSLPVYHYLRLRVSPDRIEITPVGVRAVEGGYERREPVRVLRYPDLAADDRPQVRTLRHITITRTGPPTATWE